MEPRSYTLLTRATPVPRSDRDAGPRTAHGHTMRVVMSQRDTRTVEWSRWISARARRPMNLHPNGYAIDDFEVADEQDESGEYPVTVVLTGPKC